MPRRTRQHGKDEWPRTIVGCLRAANLLLAKAWTPNALALDHRGFLCDPGEPYAVAWSITGAILKVRHNELVAVSTVETLQIALLRDFAHEGTLLRWETCPARTADEVRALLIRAERHVRDAKHPHPPKDLIKNETSYTALDRRKAS